MPEGYDSEQYKRDGGFVINTREPMADSRTPNTLEDERSLSSPKWSGSTATVGEEVTLSVHVQSKQGMRSAVHFEIYPEGANPETDAPIAKRTAKVEGNKAEAVWRYVYVHDPDNPLTEKPKFFFTAWGFKCEKVTSGNVEMGENLVIELINQYGKPLKEVSYTLTGPGGNKNEGSTDDNGLIKESNLIPGYYVVKFEKD